MVATILRLYADEVREGDELLRGPQGHALPDAPTVFSVDTVEGVIVARLIDDTGEFTEARWCPDSPLKVSAGDDRGQA